MRYDLPISVIMPCHNVEKYVGKAVESMLSQSYESFELIIINDGATDGTADELRKFFDKRIRVITLPENKGNYPARNLGLNHARGKYVCVMDGDDIAHKDRLQVQYEYMERYRRLAAIGSCGYYIDESGEVTGDLEMPVCPPAKLKTFLLLENYTLHPSLFVRRALIERHNIRYNEHYRYSSDYEFVARCMQYAPVRNLPDRLMYYRRRADQISTAHRDGQQEVAAMIRAGQLKLFQLTTSAEDDMLWAKLMARRYVSSREELVQGVLLLNRILEHNRRLGLYHSGYLHQVFDFVLLFQLEQLQYAERLSGAPDASAFKEFTQFAEE